MRLCTFLLTRETLELLDRLCLMAHYETTPEVLVLTFPGQGDGGIDLIRKIMDPTIGTNPLDFQILSILGSTQMIQIERRRNPRGIFDFPRGSHRRLLIQMNATEAFRDMIVNYITGRAYLEPYVWNYFVGGNYVKYFEASDRARQIQPYPVLGRYMPPYPNRAPVNAPQPPQQENGADEEIDVENSNDSRASSVLGAASGTPYSPPYSPHSPRYSLFADEPEEGVPPEPANIPRPPTPHAPPNPPAERLPNRPVARAQNRIDNNNRPGPSRHAWPPPPPPPYHSMHNYAPYDTNRRSYQNAPPNYDYQYMNSRYSYLLQLPL
ncbi:hypothetical protein GCK72_006003 [Caenorhabditis remanei]|uniref:Uncharacterized protein n=1 Tax=Caenorhabditis remanei TaxID=31234 RepID=A0A6A5HH13_CAERE|nr:hypothetical protein GCK72_006003 [Caenorhabditis remanei]KAF1766047.1 hypothetical protein GCK72_006003 [Caenorhabditis remanei]